MGLLVDVNPVLKAVLSENPKKVQRAVDAHQDSLDETNVCGAGALHLAIQASNFEIVQILLDAGANPNLYSQTPEGSSPCGDYFIVAIPGGYPPLHYAIYVARPRIAELLLVRGADPELLTVDGQSALALARDKVGFEELAGQLERSVRK